MNNKTLAKTLESKSQRHEVPVFCMENEEAFIKYAIAREEARRRREIQRGLKKATRAAIARYEEAKRLDRMTGEELRTYQAIIRELRKAPGIHENTTNFKKVVAACAEGISISDILHNPVEYAGIHPAQAHWFEEFLLTNKVARKLQRPKRNMVLVAAGSLKNIKFNEAADRFESSLIYGDYGYTGKNTAYRTQSQSALSDTLAAQRDVTVAFRRKSKGKDIIVERVVDIMDHVHYVDLNIEIPEGKENDPAILAQIEARNRILREGFWYVNRETGELRHAVFFLQTASQSRLLQAVFLDEEFMSVPEAFAALGMDLLAFAKRKVVHGQSVWVLDITKYLKRIGLAGTSTVPSETISFGKEYRNTAHGYRIEGGLYTIEVIEDAFAMVNSGKYKAFDKDTGSFHTFDASEVPLKLPAGDGLIFCDEEIYQALLAEFGEDSDAWQIRLTPFAKGLMVFVPGLRKYYDANIVVTKSAMKGDLRTICHKFDTQLRIALFNKSMAQTKEKTILPYQFSHILPLSYDVLKGIVEKNLNSLLADLDDPVALAKRAGVAALNDMSGLDEDEKEYLLKKSIVTTFGAFLYAGRGENAFVHKDAMMQQWAIELLRQEVNKWVNSTIPVDGHYRFMVQDPYAILEAHRIGMRNEDGELIVPANIGMRANEVFLLDRSLKPMVDRKVVLARNPAITNGEARLVDCVAPSNYVAATRMHAFRNLCVMSVHDYNTYAMGGADNDGDTCLTITEEAIVTAAQSKSYIPVLDLYFERKDDGSIRSFETGCPYPMNKSGEADKFEFGADCVSASDYTVVFRDDQYTEELVQAIHEYSIEYVILTMNPNKIGFMTNKATQLANAIRKIRQMIDESIDEHGKPCKWTPNQLAMLKHEMVKYQEYIDLLRLVQGWEIDRAKHGGAYEEQLAAKLEFISNPPYFASYFDEKSGKRKWRTPQFLASRKGKHGVSTHSTLDKLHNFIKDWVKENLDPRIADLQAKANGLSIEDGKMKHSFYEQANILGELTAAISIDPATFELIEQRVKAIRGEYIDAVTEISDLENERKKWVMQNLPEHMHAEKFEEIEELRRAEWSDILEYFQGQATALEAAYRPEHIGYVAYYVTYTQNRKPELNEDGEVTRLRGLSLPWTVFKRQLLEAVALASGNAESTVNPYQFERGAFTMAFALENGRNGEKLAAYINEHKEIIVKAEISPRTRNTLYNVYVPVNGREVLTGWALYTALPFVAGHKQLRAIVDSCSFNGKHTVTVKVTDVQAI